MPFSWFPCLWVSWSNIRSSWSYHSQVHHNPSQLRSSKTRIFISLSATKCCRVPLAVHFTSPGKSGFNSIMNFIKFSIRDSTRLYHLPVVEGFSNYADTLYTRSYFNSWLLSLLSQLYLLPQPFFIFLFIFRNMTSFL